MAQSPFFFARRSRRFPALCFPVRALSVPDNVTCVTVDFSGKMRYNKILKYRGISRGKEPTMTEPNSQPDKIRTPAVGASAANTMTAIRLSRGMAPVGGERVIALGFFDGVHAAHRALLQKTVQLAEETGREAAVFTFPTEDETLKSCVPRLYGTTDKLALLASLGIRRTFLCPLGTVRDMTAGEFTDFLFDTLGGRVAVVGYNFRFAAGAAADADDLCRRMRDRGGDTVIQPPTLYGGAPLSSTVLRRLLTDGDVRQARALLGLPYFLSGRVEHGRGMGRTFGFPTLNLSIPEERLLPRYGVYRSAVAADGRLFPAITNIGTCPTFGARKAHAETFLTDTGADLYGEDIRVFLLDFLRPECTFSSENDLVSQINIDISKTKEQNTAAGEPESLRDAVAALGGNILWQEPGQN